MDHTHAVMTMTDPQMNAGIRSDGELVVEGMVRLLFVGFVNSCETSDVWWEAIDRSTDDPYNPIVGGWIVTLCQN